MTAIRLEHVGPVPRIAVELSGKGPFVVFLHGIGGNRGNWASQRRAFSNDFTMAAWDARGYGASDDYDEPLEFQDFGHDLRRVLDHFGVKTAHIVGLSMGGRIGMMFYSQYPEQVRSLTLVDTHRGFAHRSETDREEFIKLRRAPLLAGQEPADIAPKIADSLLGPHATAEQRQTLIDSMSQLHKHSYIKTLEATVRQDQPVDLRRIAVPTHFVVGEFDRLTPLPLAREMVAEVPQAELTMIPLAGHLSNIEQPEAFNRAVLDFVRRH